MGLERRGSLFQNTSPSELSVVSEGPLRKRQATGHRSVAAHRGKTSPFETERENETKTLSVQINSLLLALPELVHMPSETACDGRRSRCPCPSLLVTVLLPRARPSQRQSECVKTCESLPYP